MDTNDLNTLAGHLERHGLRVTVDDGAMRLEVTNPLNSRLSEEILVKGCRYVTGFDHEIGEAGEEAACAERIARILAVTTRRLMRSDSPHDENSGPSGGLGVRTTMDDPPIGLTLPLPEPSTPTDCEVCASLVRQRTEARARGDMSRVSDFNVEIRNHHQPRRKRRTV